MRTWRGETYTPNLEKRLYSLTSQLHSHTHTQNQSLGGLLEFTSRWKKYWIMFSVHLGLRMSCKKPQPSLTGGVEQADPRKPRHSGTPCVHVRARARALQKQKAKRKGDRMDYSNLEDTWLTSSKSRMKPTQYTDSFPLTTDELVHYPLPTGRSCWVVCLFFFLFFFLFLQTWVIVKVNK